LILFRFLPLDNNDGSERHTPRATAASLCSQGGNGSFSWTKTDATSHTTATPPTSHCS
jgi:hypothetical protein